MAQFLWSVVRIVARTLAQVTMRVVAQAVMLTLSISMTLWFVVSSVIIAAAAITGQTLVPLEVTVAIVTMNVAAAYYLARFAVRLVRWDTRTPWRPRRPRQPLSEPVVRRPR